MAVGAIMIGIDILKPKTVVLMSILLTSIRMRGRNLSIITDLSHKNTTANLYIQRTHFKDFIYIYIYDEVTESSQDS